MLSIEGLVLEMIMIAITNANAIRNETRQFLTIEIDLLNILGGRRNVPAQSDEEYFRKAVYTLLYNIMSDLKERLSSDVMNLFNLGVFLPRTTYTKEELVLRLSICAIRK